MDDMIIWPNISNHNSVIIFGCGKNGKTIFKYMKKTNRSGCVACFADNNKANHLNYYRGKKIISPESAKELYRNALWIISSPQNSSQMMSQLHKLDINTFGIIQPTKEEIRTMYKNIHKYWYDEDKYFMYEYGFPINIKFVTNCLKSFLYNSYYNLEIKKSNKVHNITKHYKYNVAICAIFLNEGPYIREWIEFHRIVGVEHFYLYNNMSVDNYKCILERYIAEGIVTLIEWDVPHGQISAYKNCIKRFSDETRWIGFIDLDEFVVPRKGKISDLLAKYNKYGSVLVYWKTFGSSGKCDRELKGLVTEDFKKCWPKLNDLGKCFYSTAFDLSDSKKNGLGFYHICWTKKRNKDIPPINTYGKFSIPGGLQIASKQPAEIQINHYLTKSYKEYQKKMNQPDATFETNSRTNASFLYFDSRATGTDNLIDQYLPELKRRLEGRGDI